MKPKNAKSNEFDTYFKSDDIRVRNLFGEFSSYKSNQNTNPIWFKCVCLKEFSRFPSSVSQKVQLVNAADAFLCVLSKRILDYPQDLDEKIVQNSLLYFVYYIKYCWLIRRSLPLESTPKQVHVSFKKWSEALISGCFLCQKNDTEALQHTDGPHNLVREGRVKLMYMLMDQLLEPTGSESYEQNFSKFILLDCKKEFLLFFIHGMLKRITADVFTRYNTCMNDTKISFWGILDGIFKEINFIVNLIKQYELIKSDLLKAELNVEPNISPLDNHRNVHASVSLLREHSIVLAKALAERAICLFDAKECILTDELMNLSELLTSILGDSE